MESGSTPQVLGSTITSGGAVVAVDQLVNTGAEQVILNVAVGLVIFLVTWAMLRKSQLNKG